MTKPPPIPENFRFSLPLNLLLNPQATPQSHVNTTTGTQTLKASPSRPIAGTGAADRVAEVSAGWPVKNRA